MSPDGWDVPKHQFSRGYVKFFKGYHYFNAWDLKIYLHSPLFQTGDVTHQLRFAESPIHVFDIRLNLGIDPQIQSFHKTSFPDV